MYIQLILSCTDKTEADKIAQVLLEKRSIACAKQLPVSSNFVWKGQVDHSEEILLVMDSREDLFDEIEAEVKKLHSYETFVLQAVPIIKVSKDAEVWLKETLIG